MYRAEVPIATPASTVRRCVRDRFQYANNYRGAPKEPLTKPDGIFFARFIFFMIAIAMWTSCWLCSFVPQVLWVQVLCGIIATFFTLLLFSPC